MTAPRYTGLGTSTDIFIEVFQRKAGIESGRFHSSWFDCPWRLFPNAAPVRTLTTGIAWEVTFVALDEPGIEQTFHGYAETRDRAKAALMDTITKHVSKVSADRLNPKKYAPVAQDVSTLVVIKKPWWARLLRWFRSLAG